MDAWVSKNFSMQSHRTSLKLWVSQEVPSGISLGYPVPFHLVIFFNSIRLFREKFVWHCTRNLNILPKSFWDLTNTSSWSLPIIAFVIDQDFLRRTPAGALFGIFGQQNFLPEHWLFWILPNDLATFYLLPKEFPQGSFLGIF